MGEALDLSVEASSSFTALLQCFQLSLFVFANILDSDLSAEVAKYLIIGFVHYGL